MIHTLAGADAAVTAARQIAREVVARSAASVDRENRFPTESLDALRRAGLLALLVPRDSGGGGASFEVACEIAAILGGACLSTALIWAMHSQQIAIMTDHAAGQWRDALADVAARGALVASGTSEPEKSGALLLARAPLRPDGECFHVDRPSPIVSYGDEAHYCLATMRRGPARLETDVCFVLLDRRDGRVTGDWDAMGMRGTRSVAMHFEAAVRSDRVLEKDFRHVVASTAIPTAHLAWTSAWYGAARGALDRFVALLRSDARERRRCASDLFCARLADVRLSLDLLDSMRQRLMHQFESMRAASAPPSEYEDPDWIIRLNGLKVAGSRISYATVDSLVDMAGLARGYMRDDSLRLESVFRDLRSAPLMISNDRLLHVNAKHMLVR